MIKSTIVVSIIFLTVFTSLESHAQEPDAARSDKNPAAVIASDQDSARAPERGSAEVPLSNLFPAREPAVRENINPVVAPPPPRPRQETFGVQHEFHGEFTTSFSNSNGVPK